MKKILILLLLIIPLYANAQNWYKINAMRLEYNDGTKTEWRDYTCRALIDENRNVKIFFSDETQTYRAWDDDYIHKINANGDVKIYWKALAGDGDHCVIYYMHDKHVSFIYLGIKFNDLKVWYSMLPDNI